VKVHLTRGWKSRPRRKSLPELMGQLSSEFGSIHDGARKSMENVGKTLAVMQFVDMLPLVSALKMSLPRLPPAAPATVGVSLVMGSGGVMAGSQVVVSAEWGEMIRRLVQAGVISSPPSAPLSASTAGR
jgi:hypothetical protein